MNTGNIIVKNLFPFTRACWHNSKQFIFKAGEERVVPGSFLLPNGQLQYSFLKLVGFEREDGSHMKVKKVDEKSVTLSDTEPKKRAQKYIYELESQETGEKIVNTSLDEISKQIGCNKARLASCFSTDKVKFENWMIKKFDITKFKIENGKIVGI